MLCTIFCSDLSKDHSVTYIKFFRNISNKLCFIFLFPESMIHTFKAIFSEIEHYINAEQIL